MRDILTILAGLAILVLAAALAVPPLVDWTSHRGWIDRGLSRAFGQEVRSEGALGLRLLPTPRIRMQRVRIGGASPRDASLDGMYVRAEIALTPLLAGEVRVLEARIGRAEIKLPVGTAGDWRIPARLLTDAATRKGWALEDLQIEQFLVTMAEPTTGRTDQHYAEGVRIQATSLLGPWRLEGRSGGLPVEIAIGEIGPDRTATLKLGTGGGGIARLDVDGQLALLPAAEETLRPRVTGTAKWSGGLGGVPIQAQANLALAGDVAELADLAVEAGDGPATVRLVGDGRYHLGQPALDLRLSGRRVDLAALRRRLDAARASPARWEGPPVALDLSLKLDSLAVGADEDLTRLSLSVSAQGERGELRSFEVSGPGRSTLAAEGSFWLGTAPGATGQLRLGAADGQRLARVLEGFGLPGLAGLVEPKPLEAAADVSLFDPVVSLRNLRLAQGDLRLSGAIRHTAAEDGARARLDAQLAIEGLDVSAVPQAAPLFALAKDRDLGLAIDARNVVYAGRKGGRISGRIATEGPAIVIDGLEVAALAGAQASLSGRIAPDGGGRIAGRLLAPQAAPLLDLFGQAWLGGLSRLVPPTVRQRSIDVGVEATTAPGGPRPGLSIETKLSGKLGDRPIEAATLTRSGSLAGFSAEFDSDVLLGPTTETRAATGRLRLDATREGGQLSVGGKGEIAGLALDILKPIRLGPQDDRIDAGEMSLAGPDASPLLARFGIRGPGAVPVALKLALGRRETPTVLITGEVARTRIAADLAGTSPADLRGTLSLDMLSLPWLAATLALGPVPPAAQGSVWPTARFADQPVPALGGTLAIRATTLDLGLGLRGRDAAFTLATGPTGLRFSRVDLRLGEGRLRGEFALDRQGGLASLSGDAAIEGILVQDLLGPPFAAGRLSTKLRFGGSGESVAGVMSNLGGAGDVAIEGLRLDGADAAAPARLAARILRTDDPLASQRWQALLGEELGRSALAAAAPIAAPGALVGGALRLSPLRIDADGGSWQGSATLDLRNLSLDMRGALQAKELPRGWSGSPPTLGLGWSGPLGGIRRSVDPAPLVSGLATNVLARELERVDTFEQDAAERRRRNAREEMDRERRADEARRRRERELQANPPQVPPAPPVPPMPVPPPAPRPPATNPGG